MRGVAAALTAVLCILPLIQAYRRGRAARRLARWNGGRPPARWPHASVIIPAWNERGTLETCLASLRDVDYPNYDVIVAAGGPDGTYEAAQRFEQENLRMRVISQRVEGGKNGAMNDAAGLATGEVLVFLDADGRVSSGWLKALVAALGSCEEGAVYSASTGRYVPRRRTLVSLAGEMSQVLEYEARGRVSLQGSGGMAVRRAAWDALGPLPEGAYADDWDLNARLKHGRMRVSYAPAALLETQRPATIGQWWENELRWRRIHLASLLRVARAEMPDAPAAFRALYPYVVSWAVLGLGIAAAASHPLSCTVSTALRRTWMGVTAPTLARELAGAVETAAYTGQTRWLATTAVLPVLTLLGWIAGALATVTRGRAPLHFKGPREPEAEVSFRPHPAMELVA